MLLPGGREVRVALLNKQDGADCSVSITLKGRWGTNGRLARMRPGPGLLSSRANATLAGQGIVSPLGWQGLTTGKLHGKRVEERLDGSLLRLDGRGTVGVQYTLVLGRAEGAVLVVTGTGGASS